MNRFATTTKIAHSAITIVILLSCLPATNWAKTVTMQVVDVTDDGFAEKLKSTLLKESQEKKGENKFGYGSWLAGQGVQPSKYGIEKYLKTLTSDDALFEHAKQLVAKLSDENYICLLYTSPSPRDATLSRMPSSA